MNLKKLIKELKKSGKLKLVEPSKEISKSYSEKSMNSLKAGKILLEKNLIEESISMSYYGMYNKLLSLFYRVGIKSENHIVSIYLLKEIFGFDNKNILFSKKERINKQYYTSKSLSKGEAKRMLILSENFVEELELFIDKISLSDIKGYRIKFKGLLR